MTASLLVNPHKNQVADSITAESDFGETFVDAESSKILGVGSIIAAGVDGATLVHSATIDLELEVQEFQSGGRFQMGFFGIGDNLRGFGALGLIASLDGDEFMKELWIGDSSASANDLLDNLLFDLGDTPPDRDVFNLKIQMDFISDQASDGFGLGFVFGNVDEIRLDGGNAPLAFRSAPGLQSFSAVPEPGSAVVLLSLGMLAAIRRRKLGSHDSIAA